MENTWIDTNPIAEINTAIATGDLDYFAKEIGMPQVQHIMYYLIDNHPLTPETWNRIAEQSTAYDNDLYSYNVALSFAYITRLRDNTDTPEVLKALQESIDLLTETTTYDRAGIMDDAYKNIACNDKYLSFCTRFTRMLVNEMREYNPDADLSLFKNIAMA